MSPVSTPRAQAVARLTASRQGLKRALIGPTGSESGQLHLRPWRGRMAALWRHLRWQARRQPLLAATLAAATQWWHVHPWRVPGELAWQEAQARLLPVLRRHPWAGVALSAGVGAAVVAWRPWRQGWVHRWVNPQLLPLPRRLAGWFLDALRDLPLQAVLTRVLTTVAEPPASPDPTAKPPAA